MRVRSRTELSIAQMAKWLNPVLNGWLAYYGAFYRSVLYVIFRHFNKALVRWARRKFKPLRRYKIQASKFMERISEQCPTYLPTGGRVCVDRKMPAKSTVDRPLKTSQECAISC
ncbi:hypothetical protein LG290_06330 [Halomonas sediminis]